MTGKRGRPKNPAPKRANGTGSVYWVKGKQRWCAKTPAPGSHERLFGTEEQAWEYLTAWNEKVNPQGGLTVTELAELWIEKRTPQWGVARAYNVPKQVRSTISSAPIGRVRADAITVDDVEVWLQNLAGRGLREPTIKTYRQTLSDLYQWASDPTRKLVPHNPVPAAEKPYGVKPRQTATWLDLDQADRLVRHCTDDAEQWGPLFVSCALLGLRPGEACALTRDAIDWEAGTVTVKLAIKRVGGRAVAVGEPKTGRTRTLEAPPEVMAALRRQVNTLDLAQAVYGDEWSTEWDGLIFLNTRSQRNAEAGVPPNEMSMRRHLTRICAEAGLPAITPYELRHSCASILLHKRVPPHDVALQLGTSEAMLRHHYAHLIDPVIRVAADVWRAARADG